MLFNPGAYQLSFDLIGSQRGSTASVTVTFGNYNQTFSLASDDTTSGIVTNQLVTLTSPGHLLFASNTPGDQGLLLDNVVVSTASAVPEPSSFVPLGFALLASAALLTRRKLAR
ncbi:MAG TPA: PEP-CTERM sorting domain-containing protein [Bryobacteraceae bacterium]|nr:PEP-CTERM sorting domain-containing protein [Bryobacteraceae bacterium]